MTFGLFTFKLTDWTTQIYMAKNLFDFSFTQMVILPYVSYFSHCYGKSHLYKEEFFGLSVRRNVIHDHYREVMKEQKTDHMVSVVRKWSGLQWSCLSNLKAHPCDCALQQGSTPKGSTASQDSTTSRGEEFKCMSLWGWHFPS